MEKSSKIFLWVISLSVLLVILSTGYKFLLKKNYDFLVEAPCDPASSTCYYRDCSNPDDCPPNGLENYRIFSLAASDFPKCTDNSCLNECTSAAIACEEVTCGEDEADECADTPAEPPTYQEAVTTENSLPTETPEESATSSEISLP